MKKSVGLADKGTVHIAGKEQRIRLRDEREKEIIHSKASPGIDQDQSLVNERQIPVRSPQRIRVTISP